VTELELPVSIRINWVQAVSHLDPVVNDPLEEQRVNLPPPVEVDGDEEYQVSKGEDSRMYRNQLQYLLCWPEYDSLTWDPAKFMDGLQVVGEFHQQYGREPGPSESVLGGPQTYEWDTVTARVASDGYGWYLEIVSDVWKEFALREGGDVDRLENRVRRLWDGGGIIC